MGKVERVPQLLVNLDSGNTSFRRWICSCVSWKQSHREATVLRWLDIPSRSVGVQAVGEPSTRFCFFAKLYCTRHRWPNYIVPGIVGQTILYRASLVKLYCTKHRWFLNPGKKKGGKRLPLHSLQAWISRALIKGEAPAIIIVQRNFSHWSGEFPTEANLIGLFAAII